ncbi:hypothetical protein EVAR_58499_1 [Eumeta japonica]|uniref:Uncharacterized protein n=1 Tax=Eumeta variegata TaxID=151549 RepID=A0A4C1Z7M3_EUMVA|nr:hypothetical protein EVAR_58499_1 [Eumeta japonica]
MTKEDKGAHARTPTRRINQLVTLAARARRSRLGGRPGIIETSPAGARGQLRPAAVDIARLRLNLFTRLLEIRISPNKLRRSIILIGKRIHVSVNLVEFHTVTESASSGFEGSGAGGAALMHKAGLAAVLIA